MPFINLGENGSGLSREILEQWEKLAISTDQGDPVCCAPAWNLAFHEVAHPERRLLCQAGDNSLIMFGEFISPEGIVYLVPMEDSWMFGQPLFGAHAPELLEESLAKLQKGRGSRLQAVVISGIRAKAPETMKLYSLFSRRYSFFHYRSNIQCSASLEGGLDGWLSRRSGNHRAKLRKAARKAREAGIFFERHCPSTPGEAAAIYQRMLNVEIRSWKGRGQCGMAEYPSRQFYAALIRRLSARARAYVIFARMNEEDVGFIFGGAAGSIYRGQQFSFVDELRHLSIGNLMQLEKITWLCELGFNRYDMGPITGPRMGYKEHWTESEWKIEAWVMRRNF